MYKIMSFFYERWKYLLGSYVAFYLASLISTGAPSLSYYIPIKVSAFGGGWYVGNLIYVALRDVRKGKVPDRLYPALKYGISGIVIVIPIWIAIEIITSLLGIDSAPFVKNFK